MRRLQLLLLGHARGRLLCGFAQGLPRAQEFARAATLTASRCGSDARRKVGALMLRLLDFDGEPHGARIKLRCLLAIEGDAIFGAVQIERRLAQQVLRLTQARHRARRCAR